MPETKLLQAIEQRHAYRDLSEEALREDQLAAIVQAGTLAPSCYNNQPWRIITVRGESLPALRECLSGGNAWALQAPAIIALCAKAADDCRLDEGRDYALFDAGLCAMNMVLQATALGLVAHPIAGFSAGKAKKALGIPKDYVLITLVILGRRKADAGPVSEDQRQRAALETRSAAETWPWAVG